MSSSQIVRLSLVEARPRTSEFRPRLAPQLCVEAEPEADAETSAHQKGYAAGIVDAEAKNAADRNAMRALVASAQAFQPEPLGEVTRLIADTVEHLVRQIVGEVPVTRLWLLDQVETAAAIIRDCDADRVLCLHPDDVALIAGADIPFQIVADPAAGRGSIRIRTGKGWIESGRSVHLDALREALGQSGDVA